MKQGDLVKCTWQPGTSFVSHLGYTQPMEHMIKGRFGFLVSEKYQGTWLVFFPEIGYTHSLSTSAFEVISETG